MTSLGYSRLKPMNKLQGFSLHQLTKLNQKLDMERVNTLHQQQDLIKQKKISKQNTLLLKKQVHSIQQQAVELVSQLQEEKTKYEQLQFLVKKAQEQIQKQKLQKHEDVMNKKEPDEYEQQKKILLQKQRKLSKLLQKLNSSSFQISKKIDIIRSLRSQRGIHSNVLDKLEREYFDVQFYYKQLLIERTLVQKQLEKYGNQFNIIYQKSNDLTKSKINQFKSQKPYSITIQQGSSNITNKQIKQNVTRRALQLNFHKQKQFHSTDRLRSKNDVNINASKLLQKKNLQQSKKLLYKKKLQAIFNDLGCQNFQDLIKRNIISNQQKFHSKFDQSNKIYEELFKIQNDIKHLQKQLHQKKNIHQHVFSSKRLNLKSQISQFQAQAEQTKDQINAFKLQFQKIINNHIINKKEKKRVSMNLIGFNESINNTQDLTFSQNKQILKELMGFFNDQIFDNYIHGVRNNQISRSRIFIDKSIVRKKNQKLSNVNLQKKVKILRTQTDNSHHSSYQIRNSQCLDTILSMNLSNDRNDKNEKHDKLSIMTQAELIEQSKRLIKQMNKKKSEFLNIGSISRK